MWVKRSPATAENGIGSASGEASGQAAPCVMPAVVVVAAPPASPVIVALVVLRGMDFYDSQVFGIVLLLGVAASALLDYRAVVRHRVPYVTPDSTNSEQM